MMADKKIRQLFYLLLINPLPAAVVVEQLVKLAPSEWEELVSYAKRYKLTGIVYNRLWHLSGQIAIPADMQKQLYQDYIQRVASNAYTIMYTSQILQALKTRGLNVIGLKGIYLLDNVYEDIGLRSLGDVDLLVREQDLAPVIACLKALGYHNKTWFDPQDDNRDLMHVPPLIKKGGLIIELHWRISFEEDPFTFDIDGLWARAVPTKIAGEDSFGLGIEDLILHLCFHTTYHHVLEDGLRNLYDIREVIQQHQDQIDWKALVRLAEDAGVDRVMALTLCLLGRVLDFTVPNPSAASLVETVDSDTVDHALNLLFYQPDSTYNIRTEHIAKFLSAKRVKDRIKLVLNRFLLPKQEMARLYNVDPNSLRIYWYYPLRVVKFIASNPGVVKGLLKRGVTGQEVSQGSEEFLTHYDQQLQLRDWMTRQ